MHLRVRSTPPSVICAPETSLICPAGHVPSSTRMRWPKRKSTMFRSVMTVSAVAGEASSQRMRLAGSARAGAVTALMIAKLASLALDLQPVGADIDLHALGLFL